MSESYAQPPAKRVYVQCHNRATEAVEATESTLLSLPGGACVGFIRDRDGKVIVDDAGWVETHSWNVGFLTFAAKQQGYARNVSEQRPESFLERLKQNAPA